MAYMIRLAIYSIALPSHYPRKTPEYQAHTQTGGKTQKQQADRQTGSKEVAAEAEAAGFAYQATIQVFSP